MSYRRCTKSAATLFLLTGAILVIATHLAAQSLPPDLSQLRLVAVTPIVDDVGMRDDLARWATIRLTALLSRRGVHLVPAAQVELELREAGVRPRDLLSLAATETVAQRLGADAVLTGRLVTADSEGGRMGNPERIPSESTVTFALRLMVVPTRELSYSAVTGYGVGVIPGLVRAADRALQQYVDLWPATLP